MCTVFICIQSVYYTCKTLNFREDYCSKYELGVWKSIKNSFFYFLHALRKTKPSCKISVLKNLIYGNQDFNGNVIYKITWSNEEFGSFTWAVFSFLFARTLILIQFFLV